jgi:hypothetical protein
LAVLATAGFVIYEKVGAGISGYEFDVEVWTDRSLRGHAVCLDAQ